MKQFYNFEAICASAEAAINRIADESGLEQCHPLVIYAVLEALAGPLWQLKAQGGAVATGVAREGLVAYTSSKLARRVEVLKSPQSLTVNGVMDQIVDALANGEQPFVTHQEAFLSAIEYLTQGGVVEKIDNGDLRLITTK